MFIRLVLGYPQCTLYKLDISKQILDSARAKLGVRAVLLQEDACEFDAHNAFGVTQFNRIILSYSLSMIPDRQAALAGAIRYLAPGGSLHIVDFGTQSRLPRFANATLNTWLACVQFTPRRELHAELNMLSDQNCRGLEVQHLFRSHALYAVSRSVKPVPVGCSGPESDCVWRTRVSGMERGAGKADRGHRAKSAS